MVRYNKSGGITSEILKEILQTFDELNIFEEERQKDIQDKKKKEAATKEDL